MIEVGEYVRVEDGGIGKVIELFGENGIKTDNENITKGWDGEGISYTYIQEIAKHSKNIIDLIEVGDYVNESKVVGKDKTSILLLIDVLIDEGQTFLRSIFEEKYIKSIVTKEQFKNIEYIVENK